MMMSLPAIELRSEKSAAIRSPSEARRRVDRLEDRRNERVKQSVRLSSEFAELNNFLGIAEGVSEALEKLSEQLFQQTLNVVQEKLTIALQEILDQPIQFRAQADSKRGKAAVEFFVIRDGSEKKAEDVMRGQGGSVKNVLSVGLRMFALATLDPERHRGFLVLDEQDCWLRPELVPRLVKMVHDAARALGFQVLMISHHDVALFDQYADRIYEFKPQADGSVEVEERVTRPAIEDRH
jgi:ABC-type glutathione transport system ATPase component